MDILDWGMMWVSAGNVPDAFIVNKFGKNPDVDTASVPEDVWGNDGIYTGFPTAAAEDVQVLSSSASDTGVLTLIGLDGSWNQTTRTVTLNGATPVTVSGGAMWRVHTGSYNTGSPTTFNVGTLTVRHATTTTNVFLVIEPGQSQSNCGAYTIPAGHTGYVQNISAAIRGPAASVRVDGSLWSRAFGVSPRLRRPFTASSDFAHVEPVVGGLLFAEKTDIIPRVMASSANNVEVTYRYDVAVLKN